jgi:hypothetical protein
MYGNTGILPHTVLGKNIVAPAQKSFSARLASAAQFLPPSMYMRLRIRRPHVRIMYGAPFFKRITTGYSPMAVTRFCVVSCAGPIPVLSRKPRSELGFRGGLTLTPWRSN